MLVRLPPEPPGFPDPERALDDPNGLLAVGGALTPEWVLTAYAQGIFPWFNDDREPILWWSPDPRAVLPCGSFHATRRLARRARAGRFEMTFDHAFAEVMLGCAAPRLDRNGRPGGTWITPGMQRVYGELHVLGVAHSIEVWYEGQLAGGLYGVSLGRMFAAESMFTRVDDASKLALWTLDRQLERWGFELIDCQVMNPHLARLGVIDVPRSRFLEQVRTQPFEHTRFGCWQLDADLAAPGAR